MTSARMPRTYLYVPGYRPDQMDKAASSGADAIIVDLEDSVPAARKDEARELVAAWLGAAESAIPEIWVRVNSNSAAVDIAATVGPRMAGIVLPKAELQQLEVIDSALARQEQQDSVEPGRYRVFALIETARGLLAAERLAEVTRVDKIGIGAADLSAELGVRRDAVDQSAMESLMLRVVIASAAGRIGAPVAPTSTDFRDLDALRVSTIRAQELGFRARTCIHPAQVEVINAVFTPGREELHAARELVAAFESAVRNGDGVLTDSAGRLVDEAVVRAARDVIARAPSDSGAPVD